MLKRKTVDIHELHGLVKKICKEHKPQSICEQLAQPPPPPPPPPPPLMPILRMSISQPHQADMLPSYLKPKIKFASAVPTKKANWDVIKPLNISKNAFWAKCQEEKLVAADVLEGLAAKFQMESIKKPGRDLGVNKTPNMKKNVALRVINSKSADAISILIASSLKRISYEHVKNCILRCDTSILDSNVIQVLIKHLPSLDQLERLQEIKDTGIKLSEAEKFMATIGEIKQLLPRLQCIDLKLQLTDLQDIQTNINTGISAGMEVKSSKKFGKILELVLMFGNYLNSGSENGQAFGFEISFLTKLKDIKDSNNKQTILHYLVDTIEKKFPELLSFHEEFHHVEEAAGVCTENIKNTLNQLNTSLKTLKFELISDKTLQPSDLVEAIHDVSDKLEVLNMMSKKMEDCYKEVGEYFSFNTKEYPMKFFFSDIKSFQEMFIQAHKENIRACKQVKELPLRNS